MSSSVAAMPLAVDTSPAQVPATPAPVEAFVGPVDAAPLLVRARELYPTAKRLAVEGEAFALLTEDDTPLFDGAARHVRRVLRSYFATRFATIPTRPVYIVLFPTFDAFDRYSQEHYGIPGKVNLGGYEQERREIIVDTSAGEHSLPSPRARARPRDRRGRLQARPALVQ